jgi:hypothetical protein
VDPAFTAAVRVTGVPAATVVIALPDEVSVREVDVATDALRTVTMSGAVAVKAPDVPVTVAVAVPALALLLAVKVRVLFSEAGFGDQEAVTPVGKPVTDRLTFPLNPFRGAIRIVDSSDAPGRMFT